MKFICVIIFAFLQLHVAGQDSSHVAYWNKLTEQFVYRAKVIEELSALFNKSGLTDTSYSRQIAASSSNLRRLLKRAKVPDSLVIIEIQELNNDLVSSLTRVLVLSENDIDLKSRKEFRSILAELMAAENRIHKAMKDYNASCERVNRRELSYKIK